ncbi:MAG: type IV secretory system conjugative DNA transfer family protein [Clostridia bacterium]|nr:type IV secretory system conjugative DNA transfer family protein [Clostridia bacterium]
MSVDHNNTKREDLLLFGVLLIPTVWFALILAPCLGGSLVDVFSRLTERIQTPWQIEWCADSPRSILICLLLYGFGGLIYFGTRPNLRQGEEHGSAKWGSPKQLNGQLAQKLSFPLTRHVRIGMDTHKHRRNLNILALGGSGAGKTRSLALPGIMECNCSYVITDPKGEILSAVGHLLIEQGYTVRVFNLVDFSQSDGYDPFRYIRDDKDVLRLIMNLIRNTTPKNAASSDPFWEKAETALLEALMFYLLYEAPENEQNFGMIMRMLSYADVKEEKESYKSPLDMLFNDLGMNDPNHIAVKQYRIYKQAAGKTAKSINISLAVRLAAFNMDQICSITDHDDMDIGEIGKRKTAIFAVIPDNDTSLSYLVGMLYTQIIQELYYQADHVYRGRLPIHVRMILDEFANVSLPEEFDKSLATMRSREISATIIVQNLAQLKGLYKEHGWETITGNCDTLLYLGGNEQSTHEYISKLLGKETIDTRTHGQTKGKSGSYSTNMQTTGRELMTPDEVRLLDNSKALLFIRGFPAVMDDKYDLNRHPNIRKTVNGGYPPYIHKEKAYPYIPFDKAFDFENAERYIYLENELEETNE